MHGGRDGSNNWQKRATLSGSADVTDIQFGPHYLGLIMVWWLFFDLLAELSSLQA